MQFEDYLISIGQEMSADKMKILLLRNMMDNASAREDHGNYGKVKAAVEKYVNPRVKKVIKIYIFTPRVQEEGETFDHFFTSLLQLVRNCNYNSAAVSIGAQNEVNDNTSAPRRESAEDKMLRDCVVHGIWDKAVQEVLLRMEKSYVRQGSIPLQNV
ncbi:hypothetical protein PR048_015270 [Dryococelus australis]|uniref:Uncharacterized protein n=1 Tax=Dryococelus australis TaxID=614101 RepID=A0ABQ9HGH2_9NEOP|nr:hypothetical protein PR048_015270 [Dryococelus australis]